MTKPEAPSEVNYIARLRDRIVNQGMEVIIEDSNVLGGRLEGIAHLEDLVFKRGSKGVAAALAIVSKASRNTERYVSAKWKGTTSIKWGRDKDGPFMLTDATGKKLDSNLDATLRPLLTASLSEKFSGFVVAELLYTSLPPVVAGNYEFKPSHLEYKIPVTSNIGKQISTSTVGLALHTYYSEAGSQKEPPKRINFNKVPGLLVLKPLAPEKNITLNAELVKQIKSSVRTYGQTIDHLFNPLELRVMQVSDLPTLCLNYINTHTTLSPANLFGGFFDYLKETVSTKKLNAISEYLQSPRSNAAALNAAFSIFIQLHNLKEDIRSKLDLQHPGHDGWVLATSSGYAKAKKRF